MKPGMASPRLCWLVIILMMMITKVSLEQCDLSPAPSTRQVHIVEDHADVYIGALLTVHKQSTDGFYGCGNVSVDGLIAYEALNWITSTLNQENGFVNGKKVVESFIPGVKLGRSFFLVFLRRTKKGIPSFVLLKMALSSPSRMSYRYPHKPQQLLVA